MNKAELITDIAKRIDFFKIQVEKGLNALMAGVKDGLVKDGKIYLRDFGTFYVVQEPAKIKRNPQTGEAVNVPAKKVVKFRFIDNFKKGIQKKEEKKKKTRRKTRRG